MLLHFASTIKENSSHDIVINSENHKFECLKIYTENNVFVLEFIFEDAHTREEHDDENVARQSIEEKLDLMGFTNAQEIAIECRFIEK